MDTLFIGKRKYFAFLLLSIILLLGYFLTKSHLILLYKCYGEAFVLGKNYLTSHDSTGHTQCLQITRPGAPFHWLPSEYPLLSLLPMLPGLVFDRFYEWIFIGITLSTIIFILIELRKSYSMKKALAYTLLLIIGGLSTALSRLDIMVSALLLFSLSATVKKRYYAAYMLLAIATMFKLFPIIFIIPTFLAELQGTKRISRKNFLGISLFFGICLSFLLLSFFIDPRQAFSPVLTAISRPVQIESVTGSIMTSLSYFNILHLCINRGYGSVNLYSVFHGVCSLSFDAIYKDIAHILQSFSLLVFVLGISLISTRFYWKRVSIQKYYYLLLLLILTTTKLFSPQFLLWIMPFVAIEYSIDSLVFYLWLGISLLTTLIYPFFYGDTYFFAGNIINLLLTIFIRNTVLAAVFVLEIKKLLKKPGLVKKKK